MSMHKKRAANIERMRLRINVLAQNVWHRTCRATCKERTK